MTDPTVRDQMVKAIRPSVPSGKRFLVRAVLSLCVVIASGCATRHARSSRPYTDKPQVYPATRYAIRGQVVEQWGERLPESKNSGWLLPDDLFEQLCLGLSVVVVGYTYSLVVEVPIALVADTVLLPLDIHRIRNFDAKEAVFAGALFGDDWPVPPETLRTHYNRENCDPLIERLLQSPGTPDHHEKILCLIEAGVGLAYIAGYNALDNAMAARILAQVSDKCPDRYFVLNALALNPLTPPDVMIAIIEAGPFERGSPSPLDALTRNPSISSEVLDALAASVEEPSILISVARHPATSPATLDRIAQRRIKSVNRVIAANPLVQPQTIAALVPSLNDPEIDAALAFNPVTPPAMLHRIVKDVSDPLIGKWILLGVSRHPAATAETLRLVLETCDELDRHPAAWDAKGVIEDARQTASERLNLRQHGP